MNQADRDAEQYMEAAARWRERMIYRAKETGEAYYVNQFGEVIIQNQQHKAKNEGEQK
jgi:predicted ATPase